MVSSHVRSHFGNQILPSPLRQESSVPFTNLVSALPGQQEKRPFARAHLYCTDASLLTKTDRYGHRQLSREAGSFTLLGISKSVTLPEP